MGGKMILRDVLPTEFFQSFMNTRAATMLDAEISREWFGQHDFKRWPGPHKNVNCWWELADGRCVGWNENPATGYSFPVFGKKTR